MGGLLKPLLAGPARHLAALVSDPEYRTLARLESVLGGMPRRKPFRVRVHGWTVAAPDAASFLATYREIFVQGHYRFPWPNGAPRILDLGANIGLSVLSFKRWFPAATVVAIEADPEIFGYLERNVRGNGIDGVELLNRAAWNAGGKIPFQRDGADGGRVPSEEAGGGGGGPDPGVRDAGVGAPVLVEALDLRAWLEDREFDVIKMDVEGAEDVLLPACREALRRVRYVAVEYHSVVGRPQRLDAMLALLGEQGFRVHVHSVITSPTPFVDLQTHSGFDLQLHLFGWRE